MNLEKIILDKVKAVLGEGFRLQYKTVNHKGEDINLVRFSITFDPYKDMFNDEIDPFDIEDLLNREIKLKEEKLDALKKIRELSKLPNMRLLDNEWRNPETLNGTFTVHLDKPEKWVKSMNEYFSEDKKSLIK